MKTLSQNKKIALASLLVFALSFSVLTYFLVDTEWQDKATTDVIHIAGHDEHEEHEELSRDELSDKYHQIAGEDPLFVVDPAGNITFAGERFSAFLKAEASDIEGSLFFDYVNSEDLSELASLNSRVVREKEAVSGVGPIRMLGKDHEVILMFDIVPVLVDEEVEEIIFSVRDLTDKFKKLQQEELDNAGLLRTLYPNIKNLGNANAKLMLSLIQS